MDHIDKIELSSTIRQVTYRSKAVLAPLFAPVCHAPHFIGSNLKIVRVSRALNQSGAPQKASFRSSEMRSRCAARCGPLWHRTSTLRKLRSWFLMFFKQKAQARLCTAAFWDPQKRCSRLKVLLHIPWGSGEKFTEPRHVPIAQLTQQNHLDRIHLKSWVSFVACPMHSQSNIHMMRGISSKSSISSIHIIQIIH